MSSFQNWAVQTGVGVSRAVSAGNAAAVGVADYLDWYADDPATAVSLAYVEGVTDGRALFERLPDRRTAQAGRAREGRHDQRRRNGPPRATPARSRATTACSTACAARRASRGRATIEEAFEAAATFATQPLPQGPRTVVLTTAGGWGVVTADAIARTGALELAALPDDLRAAIDEKLPPRWSRNNPIDLAGGETRDTIPEVMELVARHPDVDAIVYLGLGIQSNQARLMRDGRFYPDHGLERIVDYHERQDARFARGRGRHLRRDRQADPHRDRARDRGARQRRARRPSGRRAASVTPSANRAVTALAHLWRYARFRRAHGLD